MAIAIAEASRDACAERINQGYWRDIPVVWRTAYSASSLLLAVSQTQSALWTMVLAEGASDKTLTSLSGRYIRSAGDGILTGEILGVLTQALHVCDLGLLMGAPFAAGQLAVLAQSLACVVSAPSSVHIIAPTDPPSSPSTATAKRLRLLISRNCDRGHHVAGKYTFVNVLVDE